MASNAIYTSPDGVNWTLVSSPADLNVGGGTVTDLAWSHARAEFLTSAGSSSEMRSTDGASWIATAIGWSGAGQGRLIYSPTLAQYVLARNLSASAGSLCDSSTDGVTINSGVLFAASLTASSVNDVADGGVLVLVGNTDGNASLTDPNSDIVSDSTVWTTSDGLTVVGNITTSPYGAGSIENSPFGDPLSGAKATAVTAGGGVYVAAGKVVTASANHPFRFLTATTPTGAWAGTATSDWDSDSFPSTLVNRIAYDGSSRWVAVGTTPVGGGEYILSTTSPTGSWTHQATSLDGNTGSILKAVAYAPSIGMWVAVGVDSAAKAVVLSSPDGQTWTRRDNGFVGAWDDVVWSDTLGLFVVGGKVTLPVITTAMCMGADVLKVSGMA